MLNWERIKIDAKRNIELGRSPAGQREIIQEDTDRRDHDEHERLFMPAQQQRQCDRQKAGDRNRLCQPPFQRGNAHPAGEKNCACQAPLPEPDRAQCPPETEDGEAAEDENNGARHHACIEPADQCDDRQIDVELCLLGKRPERCEDLGRAQARLEDPWADCNPARRTASSSRQKNENGVFRPVNPRPGGAK